MSNLTSILIGVFLSGGPDGDYEAEPDGPQLFKATSKACDIIEGTLRISLHRNDVPRGGGGGGGRGLTIDIN